MGTHVRLVRAMCDGLVGNPCDVGGTHVGETHVMLVGTHVGDTHVMLVGDPWWGRPM